MRRLLAVAALLVTLPVTAPSAAPPAARPAPARVAFGAVRHVPGRVTLGVPDVAERMHRAYESLAVTKESRDLLGRYERALGDSLSDGDEQRLALAVSGPDLDGDRVGDLVVLDLTLWLTDYHFDGDTTIAVVSGRTGRQLWRRAWEDMPVPLVYWGKVGDRQPGLILASPRGETLADWGYRFVGIGGARGNLVYDKTLTGDDGRGGYVQFGGLMNAFTGGGDDILIGRVERALDINIAIGGVTPPGVDFTQAYVLDGRDGTVRAVSDRVLGVGGDPAFVAVGDLDADKRDDYAMFRFGLHEGHGSVVARSVVENKLLWTNDAVPVGRMIGIPGDGDFVGDSRGDLLYETWMSGVPLVEVRPVTDEMVLFHGAMPGTHAVFLDGRDGSLERRLGDGTYRGYMPFRDVDGDRKKDIVTYAWTSNSRQGGLEIALLTKAGDRVRWRREILVNADVPGAASGAAWLDWAGDVDRDGYDDWSYEIYLGTTEITKRRASGIVFLRNGATISTTDLMLHGTLDGRGSDRYGMAMSGQTQTFSMRDGRSGASYWRTSVTSGPLAFFVDAQLGQRGRCDGVVLVGMPEKREDAGQVWATVLDGATGRVRWSRALNGDPDTPVVKPLGGAPARCA